MNLIQPACTIMAMTAWLAIATPPTTSKNSSIMGNFAGTTPCQQMIRPLHKVSQQAECALVEWKLTLYVDPVTGKPTSYKIFSVNRFIVQGTNMYSEPGTKSEVEGKWTIIMGTKTNPRAIVYKLDPAGPGLSMSFLKISDNLIHLLDQNGNLAVGDEFFSYTLSRITN